MADESSGYEMAEHTGDICIKAAAPTLAGLFAESARGMMAYLFGEVLPDAHGSEGREQLRVTAPDLSALLVEFLAELHYRAEVQRRAYTAFEFECITANELRATIEWRAAQAEEEIKAVTYHGLSVSNTAGQWQASVVYDI